MGQEVGYRECLGYKLMERGFDDKHDLEFEREQHPEATEDELWECLWESRSFWWEDACSTGFHAKKEPDDETILEAFHACWEDVDLEIVECPRCEGEIQWPCACCSECLAPTECCTGTDSDTGEKHCISCGHGFDGLELMSDAVDALGGP